MLKFLLCFLIVINLYAIDYSKQQVQDMMYVYGFYMGQNYSLEKISYKYPHLKNKIYIAQHQFDKNFQSSVKYIDEYFSSLIPTEWNAIKKQFENELIKKTSFSEIDEQKSLEFIDKVKLRAKGSIESPIIETLLTFHPYYKKYPSKEYSNGYKKRIYSRNNRKSKSIDFHIDIPQSWRVKDGNRPNTLWLGNYKNGFLDKDDISVSLGVIVKELPEKVNSITLEDANFFCNTFFKGSPIKECNKITLENLPAIYARNTMVIKRLKSTYTTETASYIVFFENKAIFLQGMVGTINDKTTKKQINDAFDKYSTLFEQIANSLVINNIYTNQKNTSKQFYTYKLFNNKFQVVFPDEPTLQKIPKELIDPKTILKSISHKYAKNLTKKQRDEVVFQTIKLIKKTIQYNYIDESNQISYIAQTMPSEPEHKNFIILGMKQQIDNFTQSSLKATGNNIIEFTSILDKDNKIYTAIHTSSFFYEGQKAYTSTKHIIYKDKVYRWSISYTNKNDKPIFDNYKYKVKVLK